MSGWRIVALLVLAALAGGVIWKSLPARTASVEGLNPIAELISAEIGGMTQWLLIRGADREAPILLWLHGGPGAAQMPIHSVTAALERDFVVVHWDQRGAGKSNPPDFDSETMTLAQCLHERPAPVFSLPFVPLVRSTDDVFFCFLVNNQHLFTFQAAFLSLHAKANLLWDWRDKRSNRFSNSSLCHSGTATDSGNSAIESQVSSTSRILSSTGISAISVADMFFISNRPQSQEWLVSFIAERSP